MTGLADEATVARVQEVEPAGYAAKAFHCGDLRATLAVALANSRACRTS